MRKYFDPRPGLIIVTKGKHGDRYFDASTEKALNASLRKIFAENQEMQFYCCVKDEVVSLHERILELEEQAKPLPDGLSAAHYKLQMDAHHTLLKKKRELKGAIEDAEILKKAEQGDVESIKTLLQRRRDYEYEGFSLEELE